MNSEEEREQVLRFYRENRRLTENPLVFLMKCLSFHGVRHLAINNPNPPRVDISYKQLGEMAKIIVQHTEFNRPWYKEEYSETIITYNVVYEEIPITVDVVYGLETQTVQYYVEQTRYFENFQRVMVNLLLRMFKSVPKLAVSLNSTPHLFYWFQRRFVVQSVDQVVVEYENHVEYNSREIRNEIQNFNQNVVSAKWNTGDLWKRTLPRFLTPEKITTLGGYVDDEFLMSEPCKHLKLVGSQVTCDGLRSYLQQWVVNGTHETFWLKVFSSRFTSRLLSGIFDEVSELGHRINLKDGTGEDGITEFVLCLPDMIFLDVTYGQDWILLKVS